MCDNPLLPFTEKWARSISHIAMGRYHFVFCLCFFIKLTLALPALFLSSSPSSSTPKLSSFSFIKVSYPPVASNEQLFEFMLLAEFRNARSQCGLTTGQTVYPFKGVSGNAVVAGTATTSGMNTPDCSCLRLYLHSDHLCF